MSPKTGTTTSAERAAFLACLPLIVNVAFIPHQGTVPVGEISQKYQDWLPHVTHENPADVFAILKVCDDYEEGKTFYLEADAN